MNLTDHDRAEIRDLVERYAVLVDARDFTGVSRLFQPNGQLVLPDPPGKLCPIRTVSGREAIERELSRLEAFTVTFHGVCGLSVDSEDNSDLAMGRVNCIAHHIRHTDDGPKDLEWYLRYRDNYQRTDSGWLLARRAITIEIIDSRNVKRANDTPFQG